MYLHQSSWLVHSHLVHNSIRYLPDDAVNSAQPYCRTPFSLKHTRHSSVWTVCRYFVCLFAFCLLICCCELRTFTLATERHHALHIVGLISDFRWHLVAVICSLHRSVSHICLDCLSELCQCYMLCLLWLLLLLWVFPVSFSLVCRSRCDTSWSLSLHVLVCWRAESLVKWE